MNIIQTSIRSGIIIFAIIIIRSLWVHRLPKNFTVVLWEIALLSLSVPLNLRVTRTGASFSIPTEPAASVTQVKNGAIQEALYSPDRSTANIPVLRLIWLAGVLAFATFFVISYIRCRQGYKDAEFYTNGFLSEWFSRHALRRTVTVKVTDAVTSPMTYGIFKPIILLPKNLNIQNQEQLNYILLHEYCHIRQFDGLLKLWANTVLCLHWFNPLVWVMRRLLIRDIELRCDENVLKELGIDCRKDYAMTIIELQEIRSGFSPVGSSIAKDAITERIEAIMKYKKRNILSAILAAAILISAVTVSVYAIDNAAEEQKQQRESVAAVKAAEERQDYEVLEMNDDGVCYVKMTPVKNGCSYEYNNFAFKGTVIFTDENGKPFDTILGETDHINITIDNSSATEFAGIIGFLAEGENISSTTHQKENDPVPCPR